MSALGRLDSKLGNVSRSTAIRIPSTDSIDYVIAALQKQTGLASNVSIPEDLLQEAVARFWEAQRFDSLRDARLVSFGLCVSGNLHRRCIMEDRQRFQAVLDAQGGVDQWLTEPRKYRRCYQGLVRSYFSYNADADSAPRVGRENWGHLRDYLQERVRSIEDSRLNPDWVKVTAENTKIFGVDPCAPYSEALLAGNTSTIDLLCEQLGIDKASWFLRELVLAQVRRATSYGQQDFKSVIPFLLELLADNAVLRDRGLIAVLDRYAELDQPGINEPLRNAAVDWWGNPWLPSNEMRWGGVSARAREMVAEWLKREFIEAFFSKLAEDGVGDTRRANFWLKYVKSIDNIQFALGSTALRSRDRDFIVLRQKMKGLFTELKDTNGANNAFVMTMGDLVAVEFGGMGNAFYGYNRRQDLRFDLSRPVRTTVGAENSLKHKNHVLWMRHQDGILGWRRWEEMFEAKLKQNFNVMPGAVANRAVQESPTNTRQVAGLGAPTQSRSNEVPANRFSKSEPFSMMALHMYAKEKNLKVEDFSAGDRGGNLWVRTDDADLRVTEKLASWNFTYKPGKGWWRQ